MIDLEFLTDLIDFRVNYLTEEINRILRKWDYTALSDFLMHSKDGTLSKAEEDAIYITTLMDEKEDLLKKKLSWNSLKKQKLELFQQT